MRITRRRHKNDKKKNKRTPDKRDRVRERGRGRESKVLRCYPKMLRYCGRCEYLTLTEQHGSAGGCFVYCCCCCWDKMIKLRHSLLHQNAQYIRIVVYMCAMRRRRRRLATRSISWEEWRKKNKLAQSSSSAGPKHEFCCCCCCCFDICIERAPIYSFVSYVYASFLLLLLLRSLLFTSSHTFLLSIEIFELIKAFFCCITVNFC